MNNTNSRSWLDAERIESLQGPGDVFCHGFHSVILYQTSLNSGNCNKYQIANPLCFKSRNPNFYIAETNQECLSLNFHVANVDLGFMGGLP